MSLNLNVASLALQAASDLVADVEKAVAAGGGPAAEALAVAEALWADADFKAKVVALVAAVKA